MTGAVVSVADDHPTSQRNVSSIVSFGSFLQTNFVTSTTLFFQNKTKTQAKDAEKAYHGPLISFPEEQE
jgi:hypothetical protein